MLFSQKLSDKYGRKKKIRMINSMKDLLGSIMSTTLYFFTHLLRSGLSLKICHSNKICGSSSNNPSCSMSSNTAHSLFSTSSLIRLTEFCEEEGGGRWRDINNASMDPHSDRNHTLNNNRKIELC